MTVHDHLAHPCHCFCQIPNEELRPWVQKRYEAHIPTVQLLHSTDDPHEKEIISMVALLDVDEQSMLEMMGDVDQPEHHIIHLPPSSAAIRSGIASARGKHVLLPPLMRLPADE